MSTAQPVTGLSNRAQAILVMIASILGSIGASQMAISAATGGNIYVGLVVVILGAISFGIKEAVGGAQTTVPPSGGASSAPNTSTK